LSCGAASVTVVITAGPAVDVGVLAGMTSRFELF
jgi:hypothetical protein